MATSATDDLKSGIPWNAVAWFGTTIGSMLWLIPTAIQGFSNHAPFLGILATISIAITVSNSWQSWRTRAIRNPHNPHNSHDAYQQYLVLLFWIMIFVFGYIQYFGSSDLQKALGWTSWAWCVLFAFPIICFQLWWVNYSRTKDTNRE